MVRGHGVMAWWGDGMCTHVRQKLTFDIADITEKESKSKDKGAPNRQTVTAARHG